MNLTAVLQTSFGFAHEALQACLWWLFPITNFMYLEWARRAAGF